MSRRRAVALFSLLSAWLLIATPSRAVEPPSLASAANLRGAPSSAESNGLFNASTPVVVVQRDGEWVRVQIEGWLRRSDVDKKSWKRDAATVGPGATLWPEPRAAGYYGLLNAGTPVDLLERRKDWARARVTGWVHESDLASTSPEPVPVPVAVAAAPEPVRSVESEPPEPRPAQDGVSVIGLIKLRRGALRRVRAAGASAWLVPERTELAPPPDPAEQARLQELDAEAERLRGEVSEAMREPSLTDSTLARRELDKEQARVFAERADIVTARHARHTALARAAAVSSCVADDRGEFAFPSVAPGRYQLYVRVSRGDVDLEWIEHVVADRPLVQFELDEDGARGLLGYKTLLE